MNAWSPESITNLGSSGAMLLMFCYVVLRLGPANQRMWIEFHERESQKDREIRHETNNALTAIGLAVNSLTEYLKNRN